VATVAGFNVLFWILLWGALMRVFEIHFHDNPGPLGSAARALAVVY
jgi:hypothetical protein